MINKKIRIAIGIVAIFGCAIFVVAKASDGFNFGAGNTGSTTYIVESISEDSTTTIEDYDYYSYLVKNGYTPISDITELTVHCKNLLSLSGGKKQVSYIITDSGVFDRLANDMEAAKNTAASSSTAVNIHNRDSFLYNELGMDYQTYFNNGVALFMIKKIQNVDNNKGNYSVYAIYYYSYETKDQAALTQSVVNKVVSGFTGTDYEKITAAHDYLCKKVTYATDSSSYLVHTAYGALVNGSAVCEGYAKAMKLLLDAMGIECDTVVNSTHAWNIVLMDNEWYFVDVTNDDSNSCKAYFMLGQDVLFQERDMTIDSYIFNANDISYYGYTTGQNTDRRTMAGQSFGRDIVYK